MEPTCRLTEYLNSHRIPYLTDEPMSSHTSFRIGGEARLFITPSDPQKLSELLAFMSQLVIKPIIIGRGSNLLVGDQGISSPVICIDEGMSAIEISTLPDHDLSSDDVVVWAQAGASLTKLCRFCAEQGLTGLEFAFGIPGTVGGAIYMNAGAYGGEMSQVLHSARHIDLSGKAHRFTADMLDFGYRHSLYCDNSHCITGGYFVLRRGEREKILGTMEDIIAKRRDKQPIEWPSAGSTFKRPPGNYASALIDTCGLKGLTVGGAQVSEKHAGFVINKGGATAKDVLTLIAKIREIVMQKTGYDLECEVQMIGENE